MSNSSTQSNASVCEQVTGQTLHAGGQIQAPQFRAVKEEVVHWLHAPPISIDGSLGSCRSTLLLDQACEGGEERSLARRLGRPPLCRNTQNAENDSRCSDDEFAIALLFDMYTSEMYTIRKRLSLIGI